MGKFIFILSITFFLLFSQENDVSTNKLSILNVEPSLSSRAEKKVFYGEIDSLIDRARVDIMEAINLGVLSKRVAIVNFNYFGDAKFKARYREYVLKSVESLYDKNKFFRFVKSIEALYRAKINPETGILEFINTESEKDIERFTKNVDAENYAIINVVIRDYIIELFIEIRDLEHRIIWSDAWSNVWRPNKMVFLGFHQGINTGLNQFPLFFSIGLGFSSHLFKTRMDFSGFLDIGTTFKKLSPISVEILTGVLIGFDVLEWFNINYSFFEFFLTSKIALFKIKHDFSFLRIFALPVAAFGTEFIFVSNLHFFINVNILPFIIENFKDDAFFNMGLKVRFAF